MKRKAQTIIDWPTVVAKFRASGLSQSEFARQNNMNGPTLSAGLIRLKKSGKKSHKMNGRANGHSNGFVQVGAPHMIELATAKGVTIKVRENIEPAVLRSLVEGLSNE